MEPYKVISEAREKSGISLIELARKSGISDGSLYDIENIPHEVYDQAEIKTLKVICGILKIDFLKLFMLPCEFCNGLQPDPEVFCLPRPKLIENYRVSANMTKDELAEQMNFTCDGMEEILTIDDALDKWDYETVQNLSRILKIPFQLLLGVRCSRCEILTCHQFSWTRNWDKFPIKECT